MGTELKEEDEVYDDDDEVEDEDEEEGGWDGNAGFECR